MKSNMIFFLWAFWKKSYEIIVVWIELLPYDSYFEMMSNFTMFICRLLLYCGIRRLRLSLSLFIISINIYLLIYSLYLQNPIVLSCMLSELFQMLNVLNTEVYIWTSENTILSHFNTSQQPQMPCRSYVCVHVLKTKQGHAHIHEYDTAFEAVDCCWNSSVWYCR